MKTKLHTAITLAAAALLSALQPFSPSAFSSVTLGGRKIDSLRLGDSEIARRYLGGQLVYQKTQTQTPATALITGGLLQRLDAIDNTGNGHDPAALKWKDLSGNNNDGTLANYSGPHWAADNLPFNGSNQYVSTPLKLGTLNMSFTVHVVVLMQSSANYRGIFGGHNNKPGLVGGQWAGNQIYFGPTTDTDGFSAALTTAQAPMNTITCYDLVVESGTSGRLYKNGAWLADMTVTGNPITQMTSAETMTLGRAYNGTGRYLQGAIYSFAVYGRPLSPAEVAQNYAVENARFKITP